MEQKAKKERKLTKAELRRKERFEGLSADMEGRGWTAREVIANAAEVYIAGIALTLPFMAFFAAWYWLVNGGFGPDRSRPERLMLLILFVFLLVAHELLHGLVMGLSVPDGFKAVEFGVNYRLLAPYCTCIEPMKKGRILLALLFPTLVLGFGLSAIAIFAGHNLWFFLAELMIVGGAGDFYTFLWVLRLPTGREAVYSVHPYKVGLVVFERSASH